MCHAVTLSRGVQAPTPRVAERRCVVCGALADAEQTSAHLARVMFFCGLHGLEFRASAHFTVARMALSTADCWAAVDAWLRVATNEVELSLQCREVA